MNNLSSYCGLVDAKIRASDKDLPVFVTIYQDLPGYAAHDHKIVFVLILLMTRNKLLAE